jgi:hypothetical protein
LEFVIKGIATRVPSQPIPMNIRKFIIIVACLVMAGKAKAGIWDSFEKKLPFPESVLSDLKEFAENNFVYPNDSPDPQRTELITVVKMQYKQSSRSRTKHMTPRVRNPTSSARRPAP